MRYVWTLLIGIALLGAWMLMVERDKERIAKQDREAMEFTDKLHRVNNAAGEQSAAIDQALKGKP